MGFFYECVTQKFYECNLDKNLFVEDDDVEEDEMLEPFDVSGSYMGRMMELSGELMSFLIGGPRLFENNVIVETFEEWTQSNYASNYSIEVHRDCHQVYGVPLFHSQYESPTNLCFFNRQQDDQLEEMFQDPNKYGYVATQMTHLPQIPSYDPGNIMSYVPLYDG